MSSVPTEAEKWKSPLSFNIPENEPPVIPEQEQAYRVLDTRTGYYHSAPRNAMGVFASRRGAQQHLNRYIKRALYYRRDRDDAELETELRQALLIVPIQLKRLDVL